MSDTNDPRSLCCSCGRFFNHPVANQVGRDGCPECGSLSWNRVSNAVLDRIGRWLGVTQNDAEKLPEGAEKPAETDETPINTEARISLYYGEGFGPHNTPEAFSTIESSARYTAETPGQFAARVLHAAAMDVEDHYSL